MRGRTQKGRCLRSVLISTGAIAALVVCGCGGGSTTFKNRPRPAVPNSLTGVITDSQVTVSPNNIGGGPIDLLVSNQTQQSFTVTLQRSGERGTSNRDTVGPINPLQTSRIQDTLTPGDYTVSVGSSDGSVAPGTITVGPGGVCAGGKTAGRDGNCPSSSNTPLLP